eukprot:scaffold66010_cov54-Attheya_sp.AAC.1
MKREVQLRTRSKLAPGAKLHFTCVGVSNYGEGAKHLRLKFAAKDAQDVACALLNTQGSLYSAVLPQVLTDR